MKSMGWITACCFGLAATSVVANTGYPPPTGPYNPNQMAAPQESTTYNWAPMNNPQPSQPSQPAPQPVPQSAQQAGQGVGGYPAFQEPQYSNNAYAPVPAAPNTMGNNPYNVMRDAMSNMAPVNRGYATPNYPSNPWAMQQHPGGYNYPPQPATAPYGYAYPQPYSNYPTQGGWEFVPEYPAYQGYGYQAPSGYNPAYGYPAPSQGGYYQGYEQYGTPAQPPQPTYSAPGYNSYPSENTQQNPAYYPQPGFTASNPERNVTGMAPQVPIQQPSVGEPAQALPVAPMPPAPQQQSVMVNGEPARFRPITEEPVSTPEAATSEAAQ